MKYDIATTILLALWPITILLSIMMLGGPGASNNPQTVYVTSALLTYPILLFLSRLILKLPFFGFSALWSFMIVTVILTALLFKLGFVGLVYNLSMGIANEGYSTTNSGVYYNGEKIENANTSTFEILEKSTESRFDARDGDIFYLNGQVVPMNEP